MGQLKSIPFLVLSPLLALLAAGVLQPGDADATMMRLLSLEELAANAEVILVATAESSSSRWDITQSKIYTYTPFTVESQLKPGGTSLARVEVKQLGGVVDGVAMVLAGAPRFKQGEKYLLFLGPSEGEGYQVLGLAQGSFHLERGRSSGPSARYKRNLDGLLLVDPSGEFIEGDLDPLFGEGALADEMVEKVVAILNRLERKKEIGAR